MDEETRQTIQCILILLQGFFISLMGTQYNLSISTVHEFRFVPKVGAGINTTTPYLFKVVRLFMGGCDRSFGLTRSVEIRCIPF